MIRLLAYLLLGFAALMIVYGVLALRAGEASAAHGGGLLSGFGFIPIVFGIAVGLIAGATLVAVRVSRARSTQ
jgi:hypothetical protein